MFFIISLTSLGILILLALYHTIFKAKSTFLKIQGVNCITSLGILFISLYVYYLGQPGFLDLAIVYVILNYIGIASIAKYITTNYKKK